MKSRRVALLAALSTMLTAAALVIWPGSASALRSCSSSHCYALGEFGGKSSPVWLNAVSADLVVSCLDVANRSADFADWEMWMDTNDNIPGSYTWVEAGMTAGTLWSSPGHEQGFEWYWADNKPGGGGYHEHYLGPAAVDTYTNVSFYWLQNGSWAVYKGGNYVGASVANGDWAGGGQAGAEVTTTNTVVWGNAINYRYADPAWNWHGVFPSFYNDSAGLMTGYTNGTTVNAHTPTCGGRAPASQAARTRLPDNPTQLRQALVQTATRAAASNGEANPSHLQYVQTTRKAAAGLDGTQLATDEPVYLLQLSGHFTGDSIKVPHGAKKPVGNVMTLALDTRTGQVLDWGITASGDHLSHLGRVQSLS